MFRWLNLLLLLLLCFVNNSGNNTKHVTGKKGDNVILSCKFEASQILLVELIRETRDIVCQDQKNCTGRAFREGSCDVIIKNLSFSDAGKYILRVHYKKDQEVPGKKEERTFQLQILDEMSVNTGEELNLTFLLANADKVEKNSSEGWKEIHRLNLTINEFTDTDTGTYRVLDSNNEVLITVTLTESSSQPEGRLDQHPIKTNSTEQPTVEPWVLCLGITAFVILIVIVILIVVIIICKRQGRNHLQVPQEDQAHPAVLGNL